MADDARDQRDRDHPPSDEAALSARLRRTRRTARPTPSRPSFDSEPGQRPTADPSAIARGFRLSTELVAGVLVGAAIAGCSTAGSGFRRGVIVFLLLGFAAVFST